jgi:hypothetical protein
MTKILLFALLLLSVNTFSQTTQDEYNYLSRVYGEQRDTGMLVKKHYKVVELTKTYTAFSDTARNISFWGIIRKGETKPSAILMKYDKAGNGTVHICIPTINSPQSMWLQTFEAVGNTFKNDGLALQTIIWGLMRLSSQLTGK